MTSEAALLFGYSLQTPDPASATAPVNKFNRLFRAARQRELLGQQPDRYQGLAFGNLAWHPGSYETGFWVTATQTAGQRSLSAADLVHVRHWSLPANRVSAQGLRPPSSETLVHAAMHPCSPEHSRWSLHGHCPLLWHHGAAAGLPATPASAAHGTAELAHATRALVEGDRGMLVMSGHRDGVLAYAPDIQSLLELIDTALARALQASRTNRRQDAADHP